MNIKKSIYIICALLLSFLFVMKVDAKVISDDNLLLTETINGYQMLSIDVVNHLGSIDIRFTFWESVVILGFLMLPWYLIVFVILLICYITIKIRNKKKITNNLHSEKKLKKSLVVMFVILVLELLFILVMNI